MVGPNDGNHSLVWAAAKQREPRVSFEILDDGWPESVEEQGQRSGKLKNGDEEDQGNSDFCRCGVLTV